MHFTVEVRRDELGRHIFNCVPPGAMLPRIGAYTEDRRSQPVVIEVTHQREHRRRQTVNRIQER